MFRFSGKEKIQDDLVEYVQIFLTKGEIVRDEPEGAYVFSNSNRKMPHPLTGQSFSNTVKPIESTLSE